MGATRDPIESVTKAVSGCQAGISGRFCWIRARYAFARVWENLDDADYDRL